MVDREIYDKHYTPHAVDDQPFLRQWQRLFAAWYAVHPVKPRILECVEYCRAITHWRVPRATVEKLLRREDFQTLTRQFRESERLRTQELLTADYQYYLDAHRKGLDMALEAGDHRGIPAFTNPILDRIAPKRTEEGQKAAMVNIVLQGSVAKLAQSFVQGEIIEDAEVLEVLEE